eukprot:TRINITY_DN320_c0_g1_i1.p1 TRINITY_DN320_c0_g1~~TRINITY_DN320_c0_g1_i1.p1  ORF type:complete len:285 (+),score=22.52 TRINITY_DN320_c0_g1_i1:1831-2685(+)
MNPPTVIRHIQQSPHQLKIQKKQAMKILGIIFLLLALAFCQELHVLHYDGTMKVNNDKGSIFGPILVEFRKTVNMTFLAGMYVKNGVHTPYELSSRIIEFRDYKNGSFLINASCLEGRWAKKTLHNLKGYTTVEGTWEKATYSGKCEDPATNIAYEPVAEGKKSQCEYYPMPEAAVRAGYLVGEKRDTYQAPHLLNHAVFGYAYLHISCKNYLEHIGNITKETKPGTLIIATDGSHCAIIDREGDKFIHSNPVKGEITMNPLPMIKTYFKNGYVLKEYKCTNQS